MAMSVLSCCSLIPFLGTLASIAGIIVWIVYWVKVNEHKNRLQQLPEHFDSQSQIFGNPGNF
jgi:hypothetical protein